ncbi:MAG: SUMF1/EgtB/PvdO family nonheme iron enzyme [Gemmataceae bacterium]|nr:SUMF1/EgtB/PvdO family nonheme iron enzyme [Gemmataceae bacterium]
MVRLESFHSGRCTEEEVERIGSHIESCPACESRLSQLDTADDAIVAGLRDAVPSMFEWRPGTVIGEYELIELLGAGGMGRVWKARHRRMNREVAIKAMHRPAQATAQLTQRFQREVEALAALRHANIAMAFDAGENQGQPYLVMEYLAGQDLGQRLTASGAMPIKEACGYVLQAARGLAYAHEQALIHRDVKPANLFLTQEGTIKVLDLGLVRRPEDEESPLPGTGDTLRDVKLTSATTIMGTLDYAAPEQFTNSLSVDHRADVYGLGGTLFAMLAGKSPFTRSTPQKTWQAHLRDEAPPLRTLRPDAPARLERLCQKMLERDPSRRCSSMQEVIRELEAILCRPRRVGLLAGLTAAALLAAGAGYWWSRPAPAEPLIAPVASAVAAASQSQWARWLGVEVQTTNSVGMALVLVPPGEYADGKARLSEPVYVGAHETTMAAFRQFVQATGYVTEPARTKGGWMPKYERKPNESPFSEDKKWSWETPGYAVVENNPVTQVSWNDTMAFCGWLSAKEGAVYRLPTEAEARWFMRAGAGTRYYFGDDSKRTADHAWYDSNSNRRARGVGYNRPNVWGLYDTIGNATEWCSDWVKSEPQRYKVVFGGSYFDKEESLLQTIGYHVDRGASMIGFRVVREIARP